MFAFWDWYYDFKHWTLWYFVTLLVRNVVFTWPICTVYMFMIIIWFCFVFWRFLCNFTNFVILELSHIKYILLSLLCVSFILHNMCNFIFCLISVDFIDGHLFRFYVLFFLHFQSFFFFGCFCTCKLFIRSAKGKCDIQKPVYSVSTQQIVCYL